MYITELQPIGEFVLVEPQETQKISAGGIILPEIGREQVLIGKILECGEGYRNPATNDIIPMRVKPDDLVIYAKYSGTEFEEVLVRAVPDKEGLEYTLVPKVLMMRERDIYGIIRSTVPDAVVRINRLNKEDDGVFPVHKPGSREAIAHENGIEEIIHSGKAPAVKIR